jgi:hypothetical protein
MPLRGATLLLLFLFLLFLLLLLFLQLLLLLLRLLLQPLSSTVQFLRENVCCSSGNE